MRLPQRDGPDEGWYFITVCVRNREPLLGRVVNDAVERSVYGNVVNGAWHDLSGRFSCVRLDEFEVMPNHIHGIISPGDLALGQVIGAFKSLTDRGCRQAFAIKNPDCRFGRLWQPRYHDHRIRITEGLDVFRRYIRENPANWASDEHWVPGR